MSQVRSGWQQVFDICTLLLKNKQLHRLGGQASCLLVLVLLWWMNWKLFLATSVGIGGMSIYFLLQNPYWQRYCQQWRNFLAGSNRQLILAVATGASGAFCTYMAASIWSDAENQWLATGNILEGFISLTTLVVLFRSLRSRKVNSLEAKLERLLADLSHSDRLKRLVAIRQLTRLLISNRLSCEHYQQSIEYYHLMLSEPQAPVIRNALLESLAILDAKIPLKQHSAAKIPIRLQHSDKPIFDRILRD